MLTGKRYTPFEFAAMVWRRKWWLVVPTLVCGYAALIVSSRLVDQYQSEMLIQIVPQRIPDNFVKPTVTMKTEDRINALHQQVTSRTELERMITEMNLYPAERKRLPMQDVVERMSGKIVVDVVKSQQDSRDAEAFYVRFTYADRDIATRVTERIGALFIDVNARDRGSLAEATNVFLESQLELARQRLETQDLKLKQFRERNSGRLPTQVEFNMQAIQAAQMQLQGQTQSIASDRDRKMYLERLYQDAQVEPVATPAPVPTTSAATDVTGAAGGSAEQQLAAALDAMARLQVRVKPGHPDWDRAKRRVAELEKQVAEERAARAAGTASATSVVTITAAEQARRERLQEMRAEIERLDRQIQFKESELQRTQGAVRDYQTRIEQTPGVESESISIMRDYSTLQEEYKSLLAKSEQSRVAAELERRQVGESFRVLDPARPPLRPTGMRRLQFNALGLAFGFFVGLLSAAFLELKDTTIHRVNDVMDVFQLPVIAAIPAIVEESQRQEEKRRRWLTLSAATITVLVGGYGFWALQLWKHLT
jgi:protein tyrosine kinase modulator